MQTHKGASHSFALSNDIAKQLRLLASSEKVTLFTLMLAAYQTLLFRYTNQEDLIIGTIALGRSRADFERIIGYLANPVMVRAGITGNPTFKELLAQTRSTVIGALEHQDFPFPLLVECLHPRRDSSYSPLYQTLFIWDRPRTRNNQDLAPLGLEELSQQIAQEDITLEPFVYGQQGAPFDLTLTIFESDGALTADFRYNTDLFEPATIARMEQHLQVLLAGIVANPEQHLQNLPLLTDKEQHQLLVEWNDTQNKFPDHACLHQLIEAQVERTPDNIALSFEGQTRTYRELNSEANQLASILQAEGVAPDTLVGVCMERSLEMVVALLAVLKAGGAYVPIDPTYPQQRLNYMIEDSRIPVLLTQSQTDAINRVRTLSGAKALDTGTDLSGEKDALDTIPDLSGENVGTRFIASVVAGDGGGAGEKDVLRRKSRFIGRKRRDPIYRVRDGRGRRRHQGHLYRSRLERQSHRK